MRRLAVLLATALAVAATTLLGAPAASADPISECTTTTGTVIAVDFGHWGGPVVRGCGVDQSTGYALLHAGGFSTAGDSHDGPAFICRIGNAAFHGAAQYPTPSDEPCILTPPASAYWSFWLAPAGQNTWTYSSVGAMSELPKPGEVELWSFGGTNIAGNSGSGLPRVTPAQVRATNVATGGGSGGSGGSGGGSGGSGGSGSGSGGSGSGSGGSGGSGGSPGGGSGGSTGGTSGSTGSTGGTGGSTGGTGGASSSSGGATSAGSAGGSGTTTGSGSGSGSGSSTGSGSGGGTATHAPASLSPTPSATSHAKHGTSSHARHSASSRAQASASAAAGGSPSASGGPTVVDAAPAASTSKSSAGSAVPLTIALVVVVLLACAAGWTVRRRRRSE